jgi:hypothetical protein
VNSFDSFMSFSERKIFFPLTSNAVPKILVISNCICSQLMQDSDGWCQSVIVLVNNDTLKLN